MAEIEVRPLGVDEWEQYRSVRLTALQESPDAFVASHAEEEAETEEFWKARMQRSVRLLASREGAPVGIASVGVAGDDQPEAAQLFGLWVTPEARGSGVATALVSAGARTAAEAGKHHLLYWVGTDNGRAVAFASGFGFRPTAERRPMRVRSEDDGEEETAMTLPLLGDRGGVAPY
ncbi:GNAT family N-acetyltransferase [Oryzobacter telluris]|jgi:ribosomal protein S18 acetylase RimI-like enzyme|uniref:GNAT family N-acetyltransferase n=1 Tax=Oryzobacter telluris TaxID=3149179 RepID=UPI00370D7E55